MILMHQDSCCGRLRKTVGKSFFYSSFYNHYFFLFVVLSVTRASKEGSDSVLIMIMIRAMMIHIMARMILTSKTAITLITKTARAESGFIIHMSGTCSGPSCFC